MAPKMHEVCSCKIIEESITYQWENSWCVFFLTFGGSALPRHRYIVIRQSVEFYKFFCKILETFPFEGLSATHLGIN